MSTVLVISPEPPLFEAIRGAIEHVEGCECRWIDQSLVELDDVVDADPSVVVVQLCPSEQSSQFIPLLLEFCTDKSPAIPTIVVANEYDGPAFCDLLSCGAKECLTRPIDVPRFRFLIESLLLPARVRPVERCPTPLQRVKVSSSAAFQAVCKQAERVAGKNTSLLLTGETGVGKTFLARLIHGSSPRASQPFVSVNCGAIPENLAESELFGHKKGAFTSATEDYEGRIAAAGAGTLLLDEVDSLPPALQVKLLRVLDERVYEAVGSTKPQQMKARLITAASRPLEQAVADGSFRRDLFHRLSVIQLWIPPLRERKSEIRPLVIDWLTQFGSAEGKPAVTVADKTWDLLDEYNWPGNIRELRNSLEYATSFMRGSVLRPTDLPPSVRTGAPSDGLGRQIEGQGRTPNGFSHPVHEPDLRHARHRGERQRLQQVLENCGFNKTNAARELGISRAALYKRLQLLGL